MDTNKAKTQDSNVKLSILERIAYGLGDYSGNLVYSSISAFLLVYYISVLKVDAGVAASSFCMKIGSGIGTAALGWILGAGGFNTDPTSASAIMSINVSCIWVPLITCAIGAVCLFLFDLDKHYDQAVADLAEGKWKGSK